MIKTVLLLIVALVVVPVACYFLDEPLSELQWLILKRCLFIWAGVAITCFAVSEITRNCSQVDKIWSILPIFYAWYITSLSGMGERQVLMSCLVTLWGVRLTYNFSRRGAYKLRFWEGEEDYRWEVLRKMPGLNTRAAWFLFNLFFISLYQNGLILLFTLPILLAVAGLDMPLNWLDYTAGSAFVSFVLMEAIADQQQWNYQTEKHRLLRSGIKPEGIYAKGFTHTGLWKWMRHPNYLAEQAIWISFYFLGVAATGRWLNWSITGSLLLMLLFQGSSNFSESISAGKYPEYKDYQKSVGRFLPKLF